MPPIKNLVVLMLENRSFDHMLGFLKYEDATKKIDGLTGQETCFAADEQLPDVQVSKDAGDVHDLNPDPSHDFDQVTGQIYSQGLTRPGDMKGFVRSYHTVCKNLVHSGNVMKCFTPDRLPVLSTLAKSYGVCDRWFASVPGSTIPNRLFVHGANSAGSVNQDAIAAPFIFKTIYESMGAETIHDFRIYTSGASILLANGHLMKNQAKFASYDEDFEDDALHGHLPAYTFVEPAYDDDGNGLFASSQHPDFPVDRGESLIADIYNILVQSPQWKDMLFLILYDEHGGIYDHVVPPKLTPLPENAAFPLAPSSKGFDFTRLGVRVPAVFVSPRIKPNTIFNDRDFEHSSVVATVRKLFCAPGSPPISWREAQANTFENVLELEDDKVRRDRVDLHPIVAGPIDLRAGADTRSATDLSVLMAESMQHSLQAHGLRLPKEPIGTTAAQVSRYLLQTRDTVLAGGR